MTTDRWIRASDQDRDRTAGLLSEAYAVGRLMRDELEDRLTAAYSARTRGELRELTADLPAPAVSVGLPSDVVISRGEPSKNRPRLSGQMGWILPLVLAAPLPCVVIPMALWVAAVLIPLVLMLPPGLTSALGAFTRSDNRRGTAAAGEDPDGRQCSYPAYRSR